MVYQGHGQQWFLRTFGLRTRTWTWTVCWKLDFNLSGYLDDTGLKEKKKLTDIGFYGFSDLESFGFLTGYLDRLI